MKLVQNTHAILSWEDITEGLASGLALVLPKGATSLSLDAEALEKIKGYLDFED